VVAVEHLSFLAKRAMDMPIVCWLPSALSFCCHWNLTPELGMLLVFGDAEDFSKLFMSKPLKNPALTMMGSIRDEGFGKSAVSDRDPDCA
jgi:hypothetical protein